MLRSLTNLWQAIAKATPWKHHDVQGLDRTAPHSAPSGQLAAFARFRSGTKYWKFRRQKLWLANNFRSIPFVGGVPASALLVAVALPLYFFVLKNSGPSTLSVFSTRSGLAVSRLTPAFPPWRRSIIWRRPSVFLWQCCFAR